MLLLLLSLCQTNKTSFRGSKEVEQKSDHKSGLAQTVASAAFWVLPQTAQLDCRESRGLTAVRRTMTMLTARTTVTKRKAKVAKAGLLKLVFDAGVRRRKWEKSLQNDQVNWRKDLVKSTVCVTCTNGKSANYFSPAPAPAPLIAFVRLQSHTVRQTVRNSSLQGRQRWRMLAVANF